ncbi:hypothetical protein [Streptococcus fryi]
MTEHSKQALSLIEKELQKLERVQNFLATYEKGLITPERFVYLVNNTMKERTT